MGKTPKSSKEMADNPDISYQTRYYHRERYKIIVALGGCCNNCETMDYLEIHHIVGHDLPPGRPAAARIRDWKLQLKRHNLQCLCLTCHQYFTTVGKHKV